MTRGFWKDNERYVRTYWVPLDRCLGSWRLGAGTDDGHWWILGRSDDTINVAGKRLWAGGVRIISRLAPRRHRGGRDRCAP